MSSTSDCQNNDPPEYPDAPTDYCPDDYNNEEDVECDCDIDLGYMDDECYSE